jgi:aspartokinase
MAVRVQKFGGASLSTIEKVKSVAKHLKGLQQAGDSVIAVVSAMGSTTNELISKAYEISDHPDKRELDMLISTGERVSMSLLTMALKDLGCSALSLTGSQAGILTDQQHSEAKIIEVKPIRVESALENAQIVVIAGFQGVNSDTKEITTLGRGGTDTTAVALAGHFKVEMCEIIKEVPGICSADPRLVSGAKVFEHLAYDTMLTMCQWGAKALHSQCVGLAKQLQVPIWVGPLGGEDKGTLISKAEETQPVIAINHLPNVFAVSNPPLLPPFHHWLENEFAMNNWRAPQLIWTQRHDFGEFSIFQGDDSQLKIVAEILGRQDDKQKKIEWSQKSAVSVTAQPLPKKVSNVSKTTTIKQFDFEKGRAWIVEPDSAGELAHALHDLIF